MSARIEYDLLLVGASPSNLTLGYHFLELAKQSGKVFSIAVLEKSKEFGAHILSGAVSNPHVLTKIFPHFKDLGFPLEAVCDESHLLVLGTQKKWDMPPFLYPKSLDKTGYLVLTLSYVTSWLANQLQEKAKEVPNVTLDLFTGFSAHGVVFEEGRVAGVRVAEDAQ